MYKIIIVPVCWRWAPVAGSLGWRCSGHMGQHLWCFCVRRQGNIHCIQLINCLNLDKLRTKISLLCSFKPLEWCLQFMGWVKHGLVWIMEPCVVLVTTVFSTFPVTLNSEHLNTCILLLEGLSMYYITWKETYIQLDIHILCTCAVSLIFCMIFLHGMYL